MTDAVQAALAERTANRVNNDVLPLPDANAAPEDASAPALELKRLPDWPERFYTVEQLQQDNEARVRGLGRGDRAARRKAVKFAIGWLSRFPGADWDERWIASRIEQREDWSAEAVDEWNTDTGLAYRRGEATMGIGLLTATGAVRPSIGFLHRQHVRLRGLPNYVLEYRDPETRDRVLEVSTEHAAPGVAQERARAQAVQTLGQILAVTGKARIADITPEELVIARDAAEGNREKKPTGAAWNAMGWLGLLPDTAPTTFRTRQRKGQQTIADLVDKTGIRSEKMRDLFVDYIRVRTQGLDYATKVGYVTKLLTNFWTQLEDLYPGIDSLDLTPEQYEAWVERIQTVQVGHKKGQPRKDWSVIVGTIRAFYYDINQWAHADPDRFGEFASRNPVSPSATRAHAKRKTQQRAESHQRTRLRLPKLPILMNKVEDDRRWTKRALEATRTVEPGTEFTVDGVRLLRPVSQSAAFGGVKGGTIKHGGILVQRLDTGDLFDIVFREEQCFWRWAAFTLMSETGVRIEELEEVTHLSLVQFRLPDTGEVIPLLQIAPSKDDEERIINVSPQLASTLYAVISRIRDRGSGAIPLIRRYDYSEQTLSEPLPFLFQRYWNGENRPVNRAWVLRQLGLAAAEAGIVDDHGDPITFQNHDLRRIFATEAVLAGLPVHILAKVLGHDNLDTTQGYTAHYPQETFRHFRAFIDRRRALRPGAEYREPTTDETEAFLAHFKRRKVSLGNCGRAYGVDCIHEHACIRCSLLQVDPREEWRLIEIVENLEERIVEANQNGWFGEVEGLEITLASGRDKLAQLHRREDIDKTGPVSLGLPTIGPPT